MWQEDVSDRKWWCRWKACSGIFNIFTFVKKSFYLEMSGVGCVWVLKMCSALVYPHSLLFFLNYVCFWTASEHLDILHFQLVRDWFIWQIAGPGFIYQREISEYYQLPGCIARGYQVYLLVWGYNSLNSIKDCVWKRKARLQSSMLCGLALSP